MPQLLIHLGRGPYGMDQWEAVIANAPDEALAFAGDTVGQQAQQVQALAQAMAQGQGEVEGVILNVFQGVPANANAAEVTQDLFGTADELVFGDDVIFTAAEGSTLLEAIEAAGAALLELL